MVLGKFYSHRNDSTDPLDSIRRDIEDFERRFGQKPTVAHVSKDRADALPKRILGVSIIPLSGSVWPWQNWLRSQ